MKWYMNLKIAHKVLVFACVAIFFILLVGGVGFYNITTNSKNFNSLYKNDFGPTVNILTIKSNINRINKNVCEILLTSDNNKISQLFAEIKTLRKADNELLEQYKQQEMDTYEKNKIAEYEAGLAQYRKALNKIIELAENNRSKEAYNLYESEQPTVDSFMQVLADLSQYSEKSVDKTVKDVQHQGTVAITSISFCILFALCTAVVFIIWMTNMFSRRFGNMINLVNKIASGDLTSNVKIEATDEIGLTAIAINETASKLKNLIKEISNSAQDISASSEEMAASSEQTAQGSQQTATSTTELAQGAQEISHHVDLGVQSIGQMNKIIQGISEEAVHVAQLGNNTEQNANKGNEYVKKAVGKIDSIRTVAQDISVTVSELGNLSSEIETIVDLIKSIAGQTNLLALNAAIEAARAGEHGKGFAVVADEVKKLAGQSAEATDKITSMIKEIQGKTSIAVSTMTKATQEVEEGVAVVNDAGKALEDIIDHVKMANSKIQGITKEIEGVATNSEGVVKMVENISAITEETAASAEQISSITEEQTASLEEISASSQTLAKIAESLTVQVSAFKV